MNGVTHKTDTTWLKTPDDQPRGYIQPGALKELWFHTGTVCNLSCPFCLEGSGPTAYRLGQVTLEDVKPFVQEAIELGVEKFSFTGGEPFVVKDMIPILNYALDFKPCLVLTNGTQPLMNHLKGLATLLEKNNSLNFRVSLDYADAEKHNEGRGKGSFQKSCDSLKKLFDMGFGVSIARQQAAKENTEEVRQGYKDLISAIGLPDTTPIVAFPDFLKPGSIADVPHITESCMTRYQNEEQRESYMCAYSKMIIKYNNQMRVYACTLVDDDLDYDLGGTLKQAMQYRIMLKHHRCYSCFAQGASCSE